MIEIIMPQGGQDIEKGKVVRWLKNAGDQVRKGELLCEVETEKATFEIDSPADGYLRRIVVPAGEDAAILSVIGLIGDSAEAVVEGGRVLSEAPTAAPAAAVTPPASAPQAERDIVRISPKARRIAEENGVPISELRGTGPGGRIVEKDVADFMALRQQRPPAVKGEQVAGGRLVTLDKRRRATALKMVQSKQTVPHFYVTRHVDMTEALEYRRQLNAQAAASKGTEISINDLVVRACALALVEFPQLNASYQDEDHLMLWDDINIALAVSVGDGLMAPVVPNCDRLPLRDLARATSETVQAARSGRLLSLAPGRFTVSNMGMYEVDQFAAIISPGEAAILAVSSIGKQLVVQGSADLRIRDMMSMTLSIDHRVCDGALAARFLNKVKTLLETPGLLN